MRHFSFPTRWRHTLALVTLTTAGLGIAGMAQAVSVFVPPQDIHLSYNVKLNDGIPGVTNIIKFNTYVNGSGSAWPDSVPAGNSTLVDIFAKSSQNPPLQAFFVGITQDLPGDAGGQQHVVLFVNDTAAANAGGIAWGTLFPNTNETQLLGAILRGTTVENDNADLDQVGDFAFGDATNGNLGANGTAGSAWFNIGGTFKVVAFSDGQVIGSGDSVATYTPTANVPEPQSCALGAGGLAVVGALARRRRAATATAT